MADDSELDYLADFLRKVHKGTATWTDTIDTVNTGDDKITMDNEGATEDQYSGYSLIVTIGDNELDVYTIDVNDGNTPTTITMVDDLTEADLAGDTVECYASDAGHTVATIETTRNINLIEDSQSILIYTGESLGGTPYSIKREYTMQYKDISESALNTAFYALLEGIRKLNNRETIKGYTKPNSLIGLKFISSNNDYYNIGAGNWYGNSIRIQAEWLII